MIRRPPRSTQGVSSAASDVYKRQVYMRQEGRGIGLANKIHAYKLQDEGRDTVEANVELGFAPDLREYGVGAQIIEDQGVKSIRLMTNNPCKIVGIEGYGFKINGRVPVIIDQHEHNSFYLNTKKEKMGHLIQLQICVQVVNLPDTQQHTNVGGNMIKREVKNVYEGTLEAKGMRFGIVCARFNEFFVSKHLILSLIHISEPTRPLYISYAVFCLKKKKKKQPTLTVQTHAQSDRAQQQLTAEQ
eukprot:TRINITY_DN29303_c0_g1_i4.p1 TRINITY_DN29303_c0_g1~~TRINITY_DN29303_c0_g1_i4.p1  ORF type:complete len:244 (-),score=49.25 TRINITY_DN29303_c0_g1_i4:33-764(-)